MTAQRSGGGMRRFLTIGFVLTAVIVSLLFYRSDRSSKSDTDDVLSLPARHESSSGVVLAQSQEQSGEVGQISNIEPEEGDESSVEAHKSPRPASDRALIEMYSQWGAESIDDVDWLKNHGYPDAAQAEFYAAADEATLRALAAAGDLIAKAFLGQKLSVNDSTRNEGMAWLTDAAINGSVRALSMKAEILGDMENNSLSCRDPYSAAMFLVAAMQGDLGAINGYLLCSSALSAQDRGLVVAWASAIMADLRRDRMRLYGDEIPYQPRAGLNERISERLRGG